MLAIALILIAAVSLAAYMVSYAPASLAQKEALQSDIAAGNFMMYRAAVVAYMAAHPGVTGAIPDAGLSWESGYAKAPGLAAVTENGRLFVYTASAPAPGVVASVYRMSGNSLMVGDKASGGTLYNVHEGDTGISLPVVIPTGALVMVGGAWVP